MKRQYLPVIRCRLDNGVDVTPEYIALSIATMQHPLDVLRCLASQETQRLLEQIRRTRAGQHERYDMGALELLPGHSVTSTWISQGELVHMSPVQLHTEEEPA